VIFIKYLTASHEIILVAARCLPPYRQQSRFDTVDSRSVPFMRRIALFVFTLACAGLAQLSLSGLNNSSNNAPPSEPVRVEIARSSPLDGKTLQAMLTFRMDSTIHFYSADSLFFAIKITESTGIANPEFHLPTPHHYTNFDGSRVTVFTDNQHITLNAELAEPSWQLQGYVQFQACDDKRCFLPVKKHFSIDSKGGAEIIPPPTSTAPLAQLNSLTTQSAQPDDFSLSGKAGGYLSAQKFLEFLDNPSGAAGNSLFDGKNIWLIIALILLGGVALNLTPCVLPMMPITLAVLGAGASAQSRKRGFAIGTIYGLGMTLAYGVAGTTIILTGATFGALNASPVFNLGIAVLFILLGLGMFDIIHIDFSRFRSGIRHDSAKRGSAPVAFFMGGVAALLAGACVAPVVISVVLYATSLYAEGQSWGLLLPFILGAGMALPWPFAGAGLSFLPKPGGWMVWVRNGFGALILLIALYYCYTATHLWWSSSQAQKSAQHATPSDQQLPWQHSLEEAMQQAREQNKPIFIDFWASWCKNCLAMDATTFNDEAVQARLGDFILVKFQAENPEEEEIKKVLQRFQIVGLPSYVVLTPKQ
jgi:thiol:disulfide interchange protein